jgi:Fe-S-cluster containining protein
MRTLIAPDGEIPAGTLKKQDGKAGLCYAMPLSHQKGLLVGYNCSKCPGYCCSYPVIPLKKKDVQRLADHFGLGFKDARRKFTKVDGDEPYAMRRKEDVHYGRICRFFDTEARRCTIYAARPTICREYPGGKSCGYYDFLRAERGSQEDPEHVASTWNK